MSDNISQCVSRQRCLPPHCRRRPPCWVVPDWRHRSQPESIKLDHESLHVGHIGNLAGLTRCQAGVQRDLPRIAVTKVAGGTLAQLVRRWSDNQGMTRWLGPSGVVLVMNSTLCRQSRGGLGNLESHIVEQEMRADEPQNVSERRWQNPVGGKCRKKTPGTEAASSWARGGRGLLHGGPNT